MIKRTIIMKDRCLLLLLAVACGIAVQAKVYTIHDLAQFPGTGITADENGSTKNALPSLAIRLSYARAIRLNSRMAT